MTDHSYVDINDHHDMPTRPSAMCLLAVSAKTRTQNACTRSNNRLMLGRQPEDPSELFVKYKDKGKVIPIQTVETLRVARGSGSHIFSRKSAHRWRQCCRPYAPAAFYPHEYFWYSFLLEAESTPVP
jgi:hypothetical protein